MTVSDHIRRHEHLARELEEGLRYMETCQSCAEPGPVHVCVHCTQPHVSAAAPALVAGIHSSPDDARRPGRPAIVRVEDVTSEPAPRGRDSARSTIRKESQR